MSASSPAVSDPFRPVGPVEPARAGQRAWDAVEGGRPDLPEALSWYSDGHGPWEPSSSLRVGIDLVLVEDVARSVERFGPRYVDRIFTAHEVVCCQGDDSTGGPASYYQRLAARFAAKEAMVKVLRPAGPRPAWHDIEVRREAGGWTGMRLSGLAAELAAEAGIEEVAVSLTHEEPLAAALVVGVCGSPGSSSGAETEHRPGATKDRQASKDRGEE
jgi:holo-[acyl-carrier protein] synthase